MQIKSREFSSIVLNFSSLSLSKYCVLLRSVTSSKIAITEATAPFESNKGEALTNTFICVPSDFSIIISLFQTSMSCFKE